MTPDQIPGEVVAAAKRADHEEGVHDGRSYHEVADHQVRRLIAGAVAAERERNAAEVDALAAEFASPDGAAGTFRYLIERAAFPAIHEALKGAAGLIRGGLPDLEAKP